MKRKATRWLLIGALMLLTPIFSVAQHEDHGNGCSVRDSKKCTQVPEGGSAVSYLLAAGVSCVWERW